MRIDTVNSIRNQNVRKNGQRERESQRDGNAQQHWNYYHTYRNIRFVSYRFDRQTGISIAIHHITSHHTHHCDKIIFSHTFWQMHAWMHFKRAPLHIFVFIRKGRRFPFRSLFIFRFFSSIQCEKFSWHVAFSCQPNQNLSKTRNAT